MTSAAGGSDDGFFARFVDVNVSQGIINIDWVGLLTALIGGVLLSVFQGVVGFIQSMFVAAARPIVRLTRIVDQIVWEITGAPIPIIHQAVQTVQFDDLGAFAVVFAVVIVGATAVSVSGIVAYVR